jgi:hypothetical protein
MNQELKFVPPETLKVILVQDIFKEKDEILKQRLSNEVLTWIHHGKLFEIWKGKYQVIHQTLSWNGVKQEGPLWFGNEKDFKRSDSFCYESSYNKIDSPFKPQVVGGGLAAFPNIIFFDYSSRANYFIETLHKAYENTKPPFARINLDSESETVQEMTRELLKFSSKDVSLKHFVNIMMDYLLGNQSAKNLFVDFPYMSTYLSETSFIGTLRHDPIWDYVSNNNGMLNFATDKYENEKSKGIIKPTSGGDSVYIIKSTEALLHIEFRIALEYLRLCQNPLCRRLLPPSNTLDYCKENPECQKLRGRQRTKEFRAKKREQEKM